MATHLCGRCGYKTDDVSNFKKHLYKPKCCKSVVADVPIEELRKAFTDSLPKKEFECVKCKKFFVSKESLRKHVKSNKCVTVQQVPTLCTVLASESPESPSRSASDICAQIVTLFTKIESSLETGDRTKALEYIDLSREQLNLLKDLSTTSQDTTNTTNNITININGIDDLISFMLLTGAIE